MPLNQLKRYPELLEILHLSPSSRNESLREIFNRDIEDNPDFSFRGKRIYPIKSDGRPDMDRQFMHLTSCVENTVDATEGDQSPRRRIFDKDRSMRLHWIRHHIEERLADMIEIFSIEERDMQRRQNVVKTYIYDKREKYVIVKEPHRSGTSYYLLSAYYLNREYGEKDLKRKMKKRLPVVF
ncbi:MAG: hypothetical protein LBH04_05230 [Tannerellaceae bacterium]|jgi:hypothetical protein|nr:hypothetical protein [Tannerellaceae bacterium]